jgi:hypothetical protein
MVGLIGLVFAIHDVWVHWELVLDTAQRKGSFVWKSPVSTKTQPFTFADVRSVNVFNTSKESDSPIWCVDLVFGSGPSMGLGTADQKASADGYANCLARIMATCVTENELPDH